MEWIANLLYSVGAVLTPIFGIVIFLMRRREIRTTMQAKINQQHRKGILFVLWYNPKEFDSHCVQSLQQLSEAANLAEGFDKSVWKDIQETAKMIGELRHYSGSLNDRGLAPKDREHYSTRIAEITSALITKLNRI